MRPDMGGPMATDYGRGGGAEIPQTGGGTGEDDKDDKKDDDEHEPEAVVSEFDKRMDKSIRRSQVNLSVAPWVCFVGTAAAFTFGFHFSGGFLTSLVMVIVFVLVMMSVLEHPRVAKFCGKQTTKWRSLSSSTLFGPHSRIICALGISMGACFGWYNYSTSVEEYFAFQDYRHYSNVWPDEPASGHRDAAAIVFPAGVKPDVSQAMGFQTGHHTYCVAPIRMGASLSPRVEYWAVGKDCCVLEPPAFTCGDVANQHARSGVVLHNRTHMYDWAIHDDVSAYESAARMALARFTLVSQAKPIFMTWSADIDVTNRQYLWRGLYNLLEESAIAFPMLVILGIGAQRSAEATRSALKKNAREKANQ